LSAKKIGRGGDVENLIANGHANARRRFPAGAKHAERQILYREIAVRSIGCLDKTSPHRIVRFVQRQCHAGVLEKWR
jgi:hypothetical protein